MPLQVPNRLSISVGTVAETREETNVRNLYENLQSLPILQGRLIEGVTTNTSGFNINHGLGRAWRGFFVTHSSLSVNIWAPAAQADETKYLTLDADQNTTVDLWVF